MLASNWRGGIAAIVRGLSAVAFPPVCLCCASATATHRALCPACWSQLHFIERPYCEVLGQPMEFEAGAVSLQALASPPAYRKARSAIVHSGLGLTLVSRLKYGDRTDLALPMARWMARAGDELLAEADMIVPVPLHRLRLLARRFNQAGELARALAGLSGVPVRPLVLERRRRTRSQVGLGNAARRENVAGAFCVPASAKGAVAGKTILLVDDVYTTGATVDSATRALLAGGAAGVLVLTLSRVAMGFEPPHM